MSGGVRFEWYPWCRYVKCPSCGEEHRIIEKATNLKIYVIYCPKRGRIELTESEEMKAKIEYYEDQKAELAPILASNPLPRKKKSRPQEKRKKEEKGKTRITAKLTTQRVDYVRGSEIDNWHWCKNCTQYPAYVHSRISHPRQRPRSHLCPQCKAKEDNKDCITQ
jgi:hypothetical protein